MKGLDPRPIKRQYRRWGKLLLEAGDGGMNKFDRIYSLYSILCVRRTPISLSRLTERLECSEATVKRLIRKLREELGAPIEHRRGLGYQLRGDPQSGLSELPGLWFSPSELLALLTAHQLFAQLEPGLLDEQISPLKRRIEKLLNDPRAGDEQLTRHVRVVPVAARRIDRHRFRMICDALIKRRRVQTRYRARSSEHGTQRELSPHRLSHYRNNWYLDAWCHLRSGMRRFALERMDQIRLLDTPASPIEPGELESLDRAYGIFRGSGMHRARLRFSAFRARWIGEESWHPNQHGQWLPDGRFELCLPFDDPTELIMDILRHGPDVEVLEPPELRDAVCRALATSLQNYASQMENAQGIRN